MVKKCKKGYRRIGGGCKRIGRRLFKVKVKDKRQR